jgi:hypothetical protein
MDKPFCKHCRKSIPARGDNLSFIGYEDRYVDVVPCADGGMTPLVLDAGIFCSDQCLVEYLGTKIDREVHE